MTMSRERGFEGREGQPAFGAPTLVLHLLLKHAMPSIPLPPDRLGVRGGAKIKQTAKRCRLI